MKSRATTPILFVVLGIMTTLGLMGKLTPAAKAGNQMLARSTPLSVTFVPVTPSTIPTVTPLYQLTAQAAQQAQDAAVATSDAAMLQILQVTAQKESVELAQQQMTQSSSMLTAQVDQWTATAAPSAIPGTQTAASLDRAIVKAQITLSSAAFTATAGAPTQMVAIQRAQDEIDQAPIDFLIKMFVLSGLGVFLFSVSLFAIWEGRLRRSAAERAAREPLREPVTVVTNYPPPARVEQPNPTGPMIVPSDLKVTSTQGFSRMDKFIVPCTPDQFTELSEKLTTGERTLGINQWEKSRGATLYGATYSKVRGWMLLNEFVAETSTGELASTVALMQFMKHWLDLRQLPAEYSFVEIK